MVGINPENLPGVAQEKKKEKEALISSRLTPVVRRGDLRGSLLSS